MVVRLGAAREDVLVLLLVDVLAVLVGRDRELLAGELGEPRMSSNSEPSPMSHRPGNVNGGNGLRHPVPMSSNGLVASSLPCASPSWFPNATYDGTSRPRAVEGQLPAVEQAR